MRRNKKPKSIKSLSVLQQMLDRANTLVDEKGVRAPTNAEHDSHTRNYIASKAGNLNKGRSWAMADSNRATIWNKHQEVVSTCNDQMEDAHRQAKLAVGTLATDNNLQNRNAAQLAIFTYQQSIKEFIYLLTLPTGAFYTNADKDDKHLTGEDIITATTANLEYVKNPHIIRNLATLKKQFENPTLLAEDTEPEDLRGEVKQTETSTRPVNTRPPTQSQNRSPTTITPDITPVALQEKTQEVFALANRTIINVNAMRVDDTSGVEEKNRDYVTRENEKIAAILKPRWTKKWVPIQKEMAALKVKVEHYRGKCKSKQGELRDAKDENKSDANHKLQKSAQKYKTAIINYANAVKQLQPYFAEATKRLKLKHDLLETAKTTLETHRDALSEVTHELAKFAQVHEYGNGGKINLGVDVHKQTLDHVMKTSLRSSYQSLRSKRFFSCSFFKSSSRDGQLDFLKTIAKNYAGNNDVLIGALLLVKNQISHSWVPNGGDSGCLNHGSNLKQLITERLGAVQGYKNDSHYLNALKAAAPAVLKAAGYNDSCTTASNDAMTVRY